MSLAMFLLIFICNCKEFEIKFPTLRTGKNFLMKKMKYFIINLLRWCNLEATKK